MVVLETTTYSTTQMDLYRAEASDLTHLYIFNTTSETQTTGLMSVSA